jgi:hypothetical protein
LQIALKKILSQISLVDLKRQSGSVKIEGVKSNPK